MADDHIERVRAAYGLAASPGEGDLRPRTRHFVPDLSGTPSLAFQIRVPTSRTASHFADHYVGAEGGELHVIVSVAEFATAAEAREGLVRILAHAMAVALPRCRDRGIEVGELCYCAPADPPSQIAFTRANVLIDIASVGRTPVAVDALAARVDRQIEDRLRTRPAVTPATPER